MTNSPPKEESPQHKENSAVEIINYEVIYSFASYSSPTKSKILKSTDNPLYASIDNLNVVPTSNVTTSSTEDIQEIQTDSIPTSPNKLDCTTGLYNYNVLDCTTFSTTPNVLDSTTIPTSPNVLDSTTVPTSPNVLDSTTVPTSPNVLDSTTVPTSPNVLDSTTVPTSPNVLDSTTVPTSPNVLDSTTVPTSPNVLDCTTGDVYSAVVRENGEKVTIHVQRPLDTIKEDNIYESPMHKKPPPKPPRLDI